MAEREGIGKMASDIPKQSIGTMLRPYSMLWSTVAGLACARSGVIVGSYGSYASTDQGIFTDGATIASTLLLLVVLGILTFRDMHLTKRRVNAVMRVSIIGQICCLAVLGYLESCSTDMFELRFAFHALNEFTGILNMAYWLRRIRGSSTTTAVVLLFSAFALSEVAIYACSLAPNPWDNAAAVAMTVAQIPLIRLARKNSRAFELATPTQASDYFGFMEDNISNSSFLVITGLGVGFMSIVIGILRGFPGGVPIDFTPFTRVAYMLLAIVVSAVLVVLVLRGHRRLMTVNIWIVMQALACLSLLAYAVWPVNLENGAMFATTLNALMVAFDWYVIVAFMSYGWRDPYYYAIGGFTVFLLPRALARAAEESLAVAGVDSMTMMALMAGGIVISTQFVLLQLLRIHEQGMSRKPEERQSDGFITRVMGLDDRAGSFSGLRMVSMQHNTREMGKRFLLSDREVEVLTLYAMGYTQQRVADELFISPGTVHAHIKRIYSKTGLHSRQAILDYLEQYPE
jgi:DNA-binding CsgD family transcriptional regulator